MWFFRYARIGDQYSHLSLRIPAEPSATLLLVHGREAGERSTPFDIT